MVPATRVAVRNGLLGYRPIPIQDLPLPWQVSQLAVFELACITAELGMGVWKPVTAPAALVLLPAIRPDGVLPRWQLSHVVSDGMWAVGPAVVD
jgi:hypothetical protein